MNGTLRKIRGRTEEGHWIKGEILWFLFDGKGLNLPYGCRGRNGAKGQGFLEGVKTRCGGRGLMKEGAGGGRRQRITRPKLSPGRVG